MYVRDKMRDIDGSRIYRTKAGSEYPLHNDRYGNCKIRSGGTVVCLSRQKPDDRIGIEISPDEIDVTSVEKKAVYMEIQDWKRKKYGFHVTNPNTAQIKHKYGIIER